MKRYAILSLVSLSLLATIIACAPQQASVPQTTESGYTLTLETKPSRIWLKGPKSNQPNNELGLGGVIAKVLDAQGQPVEGIPVSFMVEPEWSADVTIWSDSTTAEDGRARAIIKPTYEGTVNVHVQVQDVIETATFLVELQVFGNSTADPNHVGLRLPL